MNWIYWLAIALAIFLFVYLLYALINAEDVT